MDATVICSHCGGQKRQSAKFCPHCGAKAPLEERLLPPLIPPEITGDQPVIFRINAPADSKIHPLLEEAYGVFKKNAAKLIFISWGIFIFSYVMGFIVQLALVAYRVPVVYQSLYYWMVHTVVYAPIGLGVTALVLGVYDEGKAGFSKMVLNSRQVLGATLFLCSEKIVYEGLSAAEKSIFGVNFWNLFFPLIFKQNVPALPGGTGSLYPVFFLLWLLMFLAGALFRSFSFLYEGFLIDGADEGFLEAARKSWIIIQANPVRILQFCAMHHLLLWTGIWIPFLGWFLLFPLGTLHWIMTYRALRAKTFGGA